MTLKVKWPTWLAALAFAALAPLAQANLVTNGDFENPGAISSDWHTAIAEPSIAENHTVVLPNPNLPGFSLMFQTTENDAATASQTLLSLAAGTYDYEFWLKGDTTGFSASFGGVPIATLQNSLDDWIFYSGSLTWALPGDFSLLFSLTPFASASLGPVFLDDVSLVAVDVGPGNDVPEPGTLVLVGAAMAAIAVVRRKKQV